MMNNNFLQLKLFCRRRGNLFQLVFRHGGMRFVIYSLNFAAILELPNDAPKIDNRTGAKIDICCSRGPVGRAVQRTFCQ